MTRELYINGHLCDLGESKPTLIFQSPIFNDLDVIQSNRSAEINLPLTRGNRAAFDLIDRIDVEDDSAAYKRFPASYYVGGFPIFTGGYAFITDITDTINITLVWGNIENFQSLFDASLRDLREQFIEIIGQDYVNWQEGTTYMSPSDPALAGFLAIDFGTGLNINYSHPSVIVESILMAIEKYHGITIENRMILSRIDGNELAIPLLSKNSGPDSWYSDRLEASAGYYGSSYATTFPISYKAENISSNKRNILIDSHWVDVRNIDKIDVSILSINGNPIAFPGRLYSGAPKAKIQLHGIKSENPALLTVLFETESITESGGFITFALSDICNQLQVDVKEYDYVMWSLFAVTTDQVESDVTAQFIFTPHYDDIQFPSPFPLAENLPDMTHAEFLSSLMTMHGFFAYSDAIYPDIIRMISADVFIDSISTGYDYRSVDTTDLRTPDTQSDTRIVDKHLIGISDWSRKIILNDQGEVWRPESTEFTMGDYAQKNIVDYDNDEDAEDLNTAGIITIENENLEKEYELATLEFSASTNRAGANVNNPERVYAFIPCYEEEMSGDTTTVNYSEPSPRILADVNTVAEDLSVKYRGGLFTRAMYFGGTEGLLASNYTGFQRILQKFRMITVYAKLTIADIYNLDFSQRIYIDVYGCYFALYSVTTGENGICECKLIKLK